MKILGLDFETTGLNATDDRVIEIGAVVWDTDLGKPLTLFSEIIKPDNFTTVPAETVKVHGITDDIVNTYGINGKTGFERLIQLLDTCDCAMAHNVPFERSFLEAEAERYSLTANIQNIRWIDTMYDVPYPEQIQTRKLTYIAAEHGIVNTHAHRAVSDVLVMLAVINNYSIEEILKRSDSPTVQVVAKVSFDEKDKAKDIGFRWNAADKFWFKEFKEIDLVSRDFPFEYDIRAL